MEGLSLASTWTTLASCRATEATAIQLRGGSERQMAQVAPSSAAMEVTGSGRYDDLKSTGDGKGGAHYVARAAACKCDGQSCGRRTDLVPVMLAASNRFLMSDLQNIGQHSCCPSSRECTAARK